jgi:[glutamine synthetase] adenylyltransferase / [glutamine synthetase]-adenylyl-L-tyrosine phosphorylase
MVTRSLRHTVESLTRKINQKSRDDFFLNLDSEYLSLFSPEEIATHLRLIDKVSPSQPMRIKIESEGNNLFNITISAYDYFSEFAIICGIMTSFGLDVESGRIFTISSSNPSEERNKILDVFKVRSSKKYRFNMVTQERFKTKLEGLVSLLDQNQLKRAREETNKTVVEFLSKFQAPFIGKIYPVKINFNNRLSDRWTAMEISSRNTPAFLYAFSNALSMQNLYIHKVNIESKGQTVYDTIFISDSQGRMVKRKKDQEILKIVTSLTKHFTYFLAWAPNPVKGTQFFDQLLNKVMEKGVSLSSYSFLNRKSSLNLLARLLGTSEFLWEDLLQMHFEELLPILRNFNNEKLHISKKNLRKSLIVKMHNSCLLEEKKNILNKFKDRELFRIDLKHLLAQQKGITSFSIALTELAEVVLEGIWHLGYNDLILKYGKPRLQNGKSSPFTICGLGKFGGKEMGFASDIELLLVYGGEGETNGKRPIQNSEFFERLGQEILYLAKSKQEEIFHVDLRLRPYGSKGSLTNSLSFLEKYYSIEGGASPFERQALTKLRWIAGDEELGRKVERLRDRFTYSGAPWDLESAFALRQRQTKELVPPGSINVKYSPGGLIDLEYAVQYDQIFHGARLPRLRTPSTLTALDRLYQYHLISSDKRNQFRETYIFLRMLIDSMRVVRGNARDLILPERDSEDFKFLARRMGYLSSSWEEGAKVLAKEINRNMTWAHRYFMDYFNFKKMEFSGESKSS